MDCGGEVFVFAVADSVWDGLGLPLEAWICLDCFAKRLCPENPPEGDTEILAEIIRQRKRFKLETFNIYDGDTRMARNSPFQIGVAEGPWSDSSHRVTAGDGWKCKRLKK